MDSIKRLFLSKLQPVAFYVKWLEKLKHRDGYNAHTALCVATFDFTLLQDMISIGDIADTHTLRLNHSTRDVLMFLMIVAGNNTDATMSGEDNIFLKKMLDEFQHPYAMQRRLAERGSVSP